jgi:hypothetical protein
MSEILCVYCNKPIFAMGKRAWVHVSDLDYAACGRGAQPASEPQPVSGDDVVLRLHLEALRRISEALGHPVKGRMDKTALDLADIAVEVIRSHGQCVELLAEAKIRCEDIRFRYEVPDKHRRSRGSAYSSGYESGWRGWALDNPYTEAHHQDAYAEGYQHANQAVALSVQAEVKKLERAS